MKLTDEELYSLAVSLGWETMSKGYGDHWTAGRRSKGPHKDLQLHGYDSPQLLNAVLNALASVGRVELETTPPTAMAVLWRCLIGRHLRSDWHEDKLEAVVRTLLQVQMPYKAVHPAFVDECVQFQNKAMQVMQCESVFPSGERCELSIDHHGFHQLHGPRVSHTWTTAQERKPKCQSVLPGTGSQCVGIKGHSGACMSREMSFWHVPQFTDYPGSG